MIATMLTLAILPVFIEACRRARAWGILAALSVSFGCFLAYSLPATIGRTGEVKEVKVQEAKASGEGRKLLELELQRAQARVADAEVDEKRRCSSSPYSDACQANRRTVREREARVTQLRKELGQAPAAKVGDIGSEDLAWAFSLAGIPADAIRKASSMAFALGLDVIIWSLVWLASSDKVSGRRHHVPARLAPTASLAITEENTAISDAEIEELRKLLQVERGPLTNQEIADRLKVSKSESSKRITKMVHAGLVTREKVGRNVAVQLLN